MKKSYRRYFRLLFKKSLMKIHDWSKTVMMMMMMMMMMVMMLAIIVKNEKI